MERVNGDGEMGSQVGFDEVTEYLENCIMSQAISAKLHSTGTVVYN